MKAMDLKKQITKIAVAARKASLTLAKIPTAEKDKALRKMAEGLLQQKDYLIRQNKKDLREAEGQKYSSALIDRLRLDEKRIAAMANCLTEVMNLKDPVGQLIQTTNRPNGLIIKKVRTPIGVIGIIYESRPNVTSDCIGLCLKSGNAVILKGGKEAIHSNSAIFTVLKDALKETGVPAEAIQFIVSTDRQAVNVLLKLNDYVDLIIPRGGEGLIRFVAEHSLIPVIKHYKGVCHTYVDEYADLNMAHKICMNAKVQRPGVCNAMETMLVHRQVALRFIPIIVDAMHKAGVEIRGCPVTRKIVKKGIKAATKKDWDEEYLDLILAVKVVDSMEDAVEHINTHGTKHSDAIVTDNEGAAEYFVRSIDSACLYVNASTRFTDGYEFGMGAEIGVSTDKLHARGPMALEELTTYKFIIEGEGQVRE